MDCGSFMAQRIQTLLIDGLGGGEAADVIRFVSALSLARAQYD
jgi:hypothetical protein